jgi:hypothetical protein
MDIRIPRADRRRIVRRDDGFTTRITLSEIKTEAELGYTIRYLMDYFTYKRSKGQPSVNKKAAGSAVIAASQAINTFLDEIGGEETLPEPTEAPVSPLVDGFIENPYSYVE